jgi:hypothetical protein
VNLSHTESKIFACLVTFIIAMTFGVGMASRDLSPEGQKAIVLNSFMCCSDSGYCTDTLYRVKTNDCLMTMDRSVRPSRFVRYDQVVYG